MQPAGPAAAAAAANKALQAAVALALPVALASCELGAGSSCCAVLLQVTMHSRFFQQGEG